ncbi:hypothetical protein BBBOND_0311150 [Babesia bigemina]|uniref:Uncharacterized protein n=1 Tax=Babesia bigemina TaxID=5866 RepID=A0A061DB56_BABBI|nr:hypothetical protein BBBOND_0311150 [Babesia bigemina]CDR97212.1 hypothetical protein BBBOND_0311150 [Babesia bigemina]|eukprot:XP_012769398.1 hypothetical protein BBBOND_0311150 [Babesia bigemina]
MAPLFKELTDCPENLRESIDWLIQVRHGNGEGLTKLSQALKKLIEEATTNATKSLTTREKQLQCKGKGFPKAFLTDAGSAESYSGSHCDEVSEKINTLKSEIKTASESDKSKKEKDLKKLQSGLEEHIAKDHSLDESTRQTKIEEVKKQQNFVKKFGEDFNNALDGDKNLLVNLCDGLEKFLGFNPSSKGYDGHGIVYSDLDRLCDAVMGFLSGVLSAVKDDEAVKTYDNMMNNKLKDVIKTLNEKNGSGRDGIAASIAAVKGWLGGYEGELKKRTDDLKNPISSILALIDSHNNEIDKDKYFDISDQIVKWTRQAGWYISHITTCEKALEDIDNNLKEQLSSKISLLKQAANGFKQDAENEDLREIYSLARHQWNAVTSFIAESTELRSSELQEYLEKRIGGLYTRIHYLRTNEFKGLQKSANSDLQMAFETVNSGIEDLLKKYGTQFVPELQTIVKSAQELHSKIKLEKSNLQKQVSSLEQRISELKGLNEKVAGTVPKALDEFEQVNERNLWNLSNPISHLKKEVNSQLGIAIKMLWTDLQKATVTAYGKNGVANRDNPGLKILETTSLGRLPKLGPRINAAAPDPDPDGPGYHLEKLLIHIKSAEKSWESASNKITPQGKLYEEVINAILNELGDKTMDGAKNKLTELLKNTITSCIKNFHDEVTNIVDGHLSTVKPALTTIKGELERLQTKSGEGAAGGVLNGESTVEKQAYDLHETIGDFMRDKVGDITDPARGSIHKDLKGLQSNIQRLNTKVAEVRKNILAVEKELIACISDADEFLEDAPKETNNMFKRLSDAINLRIDQAFTQVQKKAENLYTARKKKELNRLKLIVKNQHHAIDKIISEDRNRSLKGFCKKLHDSLLYSTPVATDGTKTALGLTFKLKDFLSNFFDNLMTQDDLTAADSNIYRINESVKDFLAELYNKQHFHTDVTKKLDAFSNVLTNFHPETMDDAPKKVLTPLKQGFGKFVDQLDKAYVSRYSGVQILEKDYNHCAKGLLTALPILFDHFSMLNKYSGSTWRDGKINKATSLGQIFTDRGYVVSDDGKQNGELQDTEKMKGFHIHRNLDKKISEAYDNEHLRWCESNKRGKAVGFNVMDTLNCFFTHLQQYNRTCHLIHRPKAKHPASIYDMLQWLSGLSYNAVHHELALNGFTQLFKKKEEKASDVDEDGPKLVDPNADSLPAYPKRITATDLSETLLDVCHYSHDVLIGILGHGQAAGRYACDFNTNPDGLLYPKDMNGLLCMLYEILKRLQQQLHFLYEQCCYETSYSGWMDCHYGKGVGGSNWMCNSMQCPEQTGNQTHRQTCDQKCNQNAECGIKSPLQSFLEDGLQGFLPHQLNGNSGKLDCQVKNHSTVPCKTPMGFADITVMASHIKTGKHLRDILALLCGSEKSPLNALCSMLSCLLPMAPKTLGDMFAFYYNLVNGWYGKNILPREHRETAFTDAVKAANFENPQTTLDIYPMFGNNQHGYGRDSAHVRGDLYSLCSADASCYDLNSQCGPYIDSLSRTTYGTFASENADKYVSWVVYLTGTFYDLLCQLCTKCSGDCGSAKSKCRVTGCAKNSCSVFEHSVFENTKKEHGVCDSIIKCRHTHPTLYALGLTYGNRTNLDGKVGSTNVPKRTCKTFIQQLEKVCSKKSILSKLIHETIPGFLFRIRAPFIWLNVALWLLSLLYLLHIMVIRLDLLHMKSHLHSPSSHRIAAQSLLAAGRVGRLVKITYLQP